MHLLQDLISVFSSLFLSRLVVLQLGAVVLTALLVFSGGDYLYATAIQSIPSSVTLIGVLAYPLGMVLPLLLLLGIGGYALKTGEKRLWHLVYVFFLALLLAVVFQSVYKGVTGRVSPSCNVIFTEEAQTCLENPHFAKESFHFGLFENGIFWGWPSGHSTSAFALGVLFFLILKRPLRFLGILFALYTLIGVSFGGHWLSDTLAGALIGTAIALSVYHIHRI